MNFALVISGWTEDVELFVAETHMNETVKNLQSSSLFVQGKYKLADTKSNTEYLVVEQYPDFVRTSFRTFRDYETANIFIKSERKDRISHTFTLFERMS